MGCAYACIERIAVNLCHRRHSLRRPHQLPPDQHPPDLRGPRPDLHQLRVPHDPADRRSRSGTPRRPSPAPPAPPAPSPSRWNRARRPPRPPASPPPGRTPPPPRSSRRGPCSSRCRGRRSSPASAGNCQSSHRTAAARACRASDGRGRRASARSRSPTAPPARSRARDISTRTPLPSSPSTFSNGTSTSSKISSAVFDPRIPSLSKCGLVENPFIVLLDDERRDPLRPRRRIALAIDHQRVGVRPVGDPVLRAVQHIPVVPLLRPQPHRHHVRPRPRLRHGERPDMLARDQPRQVLRLLRRRCRSA